MPEKKPGVVSRFFTWLGQKASDAVDWVKEEVGSFFGWYCGWIRNHWYVPIIVILLGFLVMYLGAGAAVFTGGALTPIAIAGVVLVIIGILMVFLAFVCLFI